MTKNYNFIFNCKIAINTRNQTLSRNFGEYCFAINTANDKKILKLSFNGCLCLTIFIRFSRRRVHFVGMHRRLYECVYAIIFLQSLNCIVSLRYHSADEDYIYSTQQLRVNWLWIVYWQIWMHRTTKCKGNRVAASSIICTYGCEYVYLHHTYIIEVVARYCVGRDKAGNKAQTMRITARGHQCDICMEMWRRWLSCAVYFATMGTFIYMNILCAGEARD